VDWICGRDRPRTDPMFEALGPVDGKITGAGKCNEKSYKKKIK
jgi:EH domain-containing protein 1